ncbi:hypothetical protein ACIPW9_37060 [Streptomyces sp. NPDC090052]|uniref:hypothetical protein n=1 Tax=Streptomyces sp. NPDC090052 TaxID=3365931 RepID=UPI0037F741B8
MTDREPDAGTGPGPVSQPLPPEVPAPRPEPVPGLDPEQPEPGPAADTDPLPDAGAAAPAQDWWRTPAPDEADRPSPGAPGDDPDTPAGPGPGRWEGVREEWRDTWATHGQDGIQAAHEIGAEIGAAVAAHLPDPHAAAEQRGLDIRWLLLKYNVPGIAIALLVTWGGQSSANRMAHSVAHEGVLAPLGWVLMGGLVLGALMMLPIGSWLGTAFAGLVSSVIQGLVALTRRAWGTPYIGYLLRLALAVIVWSFVIAVVRLLGRMMIHFLTGA